MAGEEADVGGDVESIGADASWAEAHSALAWWLVSGVDAAIQEAPRNWLKPPTPQKAVPAEAPEPPNVSQPSHETLAELQQWLAASANLPLAATAARRIAPHGPQNAPIMLLSDAPTLDDYSAGQPIGGDAWLLAQRMLAAIGVKAEEAYSASLSPIYTPGARLDPRDREDLGAIARRHIALAGPKRLLLFGDGPCLALLGKRLIDARGHVHKVEGVRTVATFHPRSLIQNSANKAYAWKDLLLLMEDES